VVVIGKLIGALGAHYKDDSHGPAEPFGQAPPQIRKGQGNRKKIDDAMKRFLVRPAVLSRLKALRW
jgi:hypothetical protein